MNRILEYLTNQNPTKLLGEVILLILGVLLRDFIPFAWHGISSSVLWVGRRLGGRFAYGLIQRTYLDWLVTELRELKLTGIVTNDVAKKPRLEQVFVAIRLADESASIRAMECAIATCEEVKRNPSKRHILVESLRKDLERATPEQRKEVEAYLKGKVEDKGRFEGFSSTVNSILFSGVRRFNLPYLGRGVRLLTMEGEPWTNEGLSSEYLSALLNKALRDNNRLAILGVPGAGKSTLLQFIGLAYSRSRCGDRKLRIRRNHKKVLSASKWRMPIFIPLSAVSRTHLINISRPDFCETEVAQGVSADRDGRPLGTDRRTVGVGGAVAAPSASRG